MQGQGMPNEARKSHKSGRQGKERTREEEREAEGKGSRKERNRQKLMFFLHTLTFGPSDFLWLR